VLRQSGAHLVEVGTTNRTHVNDFKVAMGERTAAILRVHSSNFRQIGFVAMPSLSDLAALAHDVNQNGEPVLLIDNLGSGSLIDTRPFGLAPEPMVGESLRAGADLVLFSGDKLLGGPQAGLIVGRADLIARLRTHPMARALRVDKLTLAALDATLRAYLAGSAEREIPIWQMISATPEAIRGRATEWSTFLRNAGVAADVEEGESAVGGGSLPGETLPTWLLALVVPQPESIATALRGLSPAIVCRIQKDRLLFDPRTVLADQDNDLLQGLRTVCVPASHGEGSRP
jgi:L-seryl-tRNA(Ser) seleniumtransferase